MAKPTNQQLHDEILNDPITLGYKIGATWKENNAIEALLNDTAVGGGSIDVLNVTKDQILASVVGSELGGLTTNKLLMWLILLQGENFNILDGEIRGQVQEVWAVGTTTRSNLASLQSRAGSRAEVLWGESTNVNTEDIAEARKLIP